VSFGVYVHVPWCASRCGYCDFNTYVPRGGEPEQYADVAVAEVALMHAATGGRRPETVFFGGGTPTLLGAADLARVLSALRPAPGAEVTVEANPETVGAAKLAALRAAGFTRVSIGMQSASAHVLATLERAHTPGAAARAARAARAAGFEHVSLDLIYGTPGETDADWRASLDAALAAEPDHVSAYALTVEPGTRLAAQVRAGIIPAPDEDALATRYELADATLSAAGLAWYEISNWARDDAARCRHNLAYWTPGADWWAIGPGAHGHVAGTRFWTHRHPRRHAAAVRRGELPIAGGETLTPEQRELERLMLGVRTREGLDGVEPIDGLLERVGERAVLTLRGRRLADGVVRALA
jgi:putative oxygen-independent coproporphyrinogen III oxidase